MLLIGNVTVSVPTDAVQLAEFNKKNVNGKRLILDVIKDHDVPHVRGMRFAHKMWTVLTNLYQSTNENRKMVLREKLKAIKMQRLIVVLHTSQRSLM